MERRAGACAAAVYDVTHDVTSRTSGAHAAEAQLQQQLWAFSYRRPVQRVGRHADFQLAVLQRAGQQPSSMLALKLKLNMVLVIRFCFWAAAARCFSRFATATIAQATSQRPLPSPRHAEAAATGLLIRTSFATK